MKTIFWFSLLVVLLGCKKEYLDESIPYTDQAIFGDARYIKVPAYTYKDIYTEKTYTFHGTSNDLISVSNSGLFTHVIPYDHYDTISCNPAFVWEKTNSRNVMVAIFNERISIDNSKCQIKNINSIVWVWNTGMSTGQEGAISYNNGCDVVDGEIQYDKAPTPLENGRSYILAIWAWDWYAKRIEYSSREIPFTVEK